MYSSRFTIAVHTLLCIERFRNDCKLTSDFIAGSVNVNPVIIRRIIGQLKKASLVTTEAGVGGTDLARDPSEITLADVFTAVEGDEPLFHFHEQPNLACPVGRSIHEVLGKRLNHLEKTMTDELRNTTLSDLRKDADIYLKDSLNENLSSVTK